WGPQSSRAAALAEYLRAEAWWLDDYTLFRALRERHGERPWWEWPPDLARRDPEALAAAELAADRARGAT
ncbi:MAG: 4-alpha-glucanotransferase, partial [Acetobacteraceae bacterium]|nr:4-alpha-glucanotransferase [Acetobacteraceae bacterium]